MQAPSRTFESDSDDKESDDDADNWGYFYNVQAGVYA